MAGLFSFFSSAPKENVEAVLAEMDENIRAAQIRLEEAKVQRDYYSGTLILYLGLGYAAYVGIYAVVLRSGSDTWREALLKLAPVLLLPIVIYYVRVVCDMYGDTQVSTQRARMNALVEKKKLKIEEVKRSASYYTTKNILERYGEDLREDFAGRPSRLPPKQVQQRELMRPSTQQLGVQRQAVPQGLLKQYSLNPSAKRPMAPQPLQVSASTRWLDRLVDAIVGEEKPSGGQFALVCIHCRSHNGLVSDAEYEAMSYKCPNCNRFNPSRLSIKRQNSTQPTRSAPQSQMSRSMTSHVAKKKPFKLSDAFSDNDRSNTIYESDENDAAAASDDSGFVERRKKEKATRAK